MTRWTPKLNTGHTLGYYYAYLRLDREGKSYVESIFNHSPITESQIQELMKRVICRVR